MKTIHFQNGDHHKADRIEIMGNGWVKAIQDNEHEPSDYRQFPAHRIMRIDGQVIYYE